MNPRDQSTTGPSSASGKSRQRIDVKRSGKPAVRTRALATALCYEPPAEQTLGFVLSNSCLCRCEFVHDGLSGRDVLNALP